MNKDLAAFENRTDDWLAKEREYEESISAWDLDEAKKIKRAHELRHSKYNATHIKGVIAPNKQFEDVSSKVVIRFLTGMSIVAILIFVMAILLQFNIIDEKFGLLIPIFIFVGISSLFPKKRREK